MEQVADYQKLKNKLSNRLWRLNNLYKIKDKSGKEITFKMNWAQLKLYYNLHYFNVILKARQLGFTTFIMIYFLDSCLFNKNHSAGVIAHTLADAGELFENKIKFAYDKLPKWLLDELETRQDNAKKLALQNHSSLTVGTSLRSGSFQKLLISEYGKISAKFPDKAKEIKTGALNTIEVGQQIFIESTAEGKTGHFYEMVQLAIRLQQTGKALSPLEPKFHFFAWFDNPDYALTDEETKAVVIPKALQDYLSKYDLTDNQKAWYALKAVIQGEDMKQEYPSTPEEAFEGSSEGAFYTQELKSVRENRQVTNISYDRKHPVYTHWDLGGGNDFMSIWFYQTINNQHRFIDYHESNGQGWEFYARLLTDKGYNYANHLFPHDGNSSIVGQELSTNKKNAMQAGIKPITVVPVTKNVYGDIMNHCRPILYNCWFDESNTAKGLAHLDNYRRTWDKVNSIWLKKPMHDDASHGADAFRTFAMAESKGLIVKDKKKPVSFSSTGTRGSYMG